MWEVMDGDSMTKRNLDRRTVRSTRFKGLSETTGDDVTVYDGDVLVLVLNKDHVTIKRMLAPKGIRIPGLHSYVRGYNPTQEND